MRRFPYLALLQVCWSLLALCVLSLSQAPAHAGETRSAEAKPLSATEFLKQSMNRYQALTSFQAQCDWNDIFDGISLPKVGGKEADVRTIIYVKPNQFKVTSNHYGASFVQTSVSDGKQLSEYSNMAGLGAMRYSAPATIAEASSMQMQHPMFCGSLLYRFFGGSNALEKLADTSRMPITYGPDVTIGGEACKTVRLYGSGLYGHAVIAISAGDFLVRRITYDSAPLMAMMGAGAKTGAGRKMLKGHTILPTSSSTTEEYREIIVNQPVASAVFDTTLPKGQNVTDMSAAGGGAESGPPVPLGSPAPDFAVTGVSRKQSVPLASLRGRVVLLDFWATWCPPCRKSLPETQKLSAEFAAKGLAVMAISDEDQPTIAKFLQSNHYTFPAYRDASGAAGKAYKVTAIPTLVILDRQGRLTAYLVGLQERSTVIAALKKAGLEMP